eukprot:m.52067 g.52067  ORF g.52067 m.52067 type:complete len:399 (-) comp13037_c0_seq1:545-1741(-)
MALSPARSPSHSSGSSPTPSPAPTPRLSNPALAAALAAAAAAPTSTTTTTTNTTSTTLPPTQGQGQGQGQAIRDARERVLLSRRAGTSLSPIPVSPESSSSALTPMAVTSPVSAAAAAMCPPLEDMGCDLAGACEGCVCGLEEDLRLRAVLRRQQVSACEGFTCSRRRSTIPSSARLAISATEDAINNNSNNSNSNSNSSSSSSGNGGILAASAPAASVATATATSTSSMAGLMSCSLSASAVSSAALAASRAPSGIVAQVSVSAPVCLPPSACDACPSCNDVCDDEHCTLCMAKREKNNLVKARCGRRTFTQCQIRRHNKNSDCWIVANGKIYNITQFLLFHPGGAECLLKKSGGVADCGPDFEFHSAQGKDLWKQFQIGSVVQCKSKDSGRRWSFW